jgi:hypothetical protein
MNFEESVAKVLMLSSDMNLGRKTEALVLSLHIQAFRAICLARRFEVKLGTFPRSLYCSWPRRIAAIVVALMIPKF